MMTLRHFGELSCCFVEIIKELKVLLFFDDPHIKVLVIRLMLKMKVGVGLINEFVNSGLEAR